MPAELPRASARTLRNLRNVRAVRTLRTMVGLAAVVFAAVVAAGWGVPAYAVAVGGQPAAAAGSQLAAAQSDQSASPRFSVSALAPVPTVSRDTYTVTSPPPLQWPVDPTSPVGSPFGDRSSPCGGCSSFHTGTDLDAGNGTEVHVIAAGTVVETDDPTMSSFGVHVAVQHVIDG